jgi:hypothetical protein
MRFTRRKKRGLSDMSRGLLVWVYTMQQDLPCILLVTKTQIGQVIALIASPLMDMSSTLDRDLSIGQVRRNKKFLYHHQRKSTRVQ